MLVELDEVIKCLRKAEDQWYRDKKDYKEHTRYDNSPDADYFGDTLKKRFEEKESKKRKIPGVGGSLDEPYIR